MVIAIDEMVERLDVFGLIAYRKSDVKTAREYLSNKAIDAVIKSHSKKGFPKTFYVTYNGTDLNREPISALSKTLSYQERKNAEMEIIQIAIKLFKTFTNI